MPSLDQHPSSSITKMLLIGDSGSGKTGALASLAHAGYNLRIYDLDNGMDAFINELMDPKTPYDKDAWKRVKYQTLTEKPAGITATVTALVPKAATVWTRLCSQLDHWKTPSEDLGTLDKWGDTDVLVIDSMTLAGIAAYNFAAVQNSGNRNIDGRMIYFHAQTYMEKLALVLFSDEVKCNVIVTSHISFIGGDDGIGAIHGYPTTIGRALSAKIGRYFNTVLMVKSDEQKKRKIYTVPTSRVELKNSAPLRVKDSYDIKFGLMEFFKDVQGSSPGHN